MSWEHLFRDMANGKIPYSPTYYQYPKHRAANAKSNDSGITIVSPTEQQVQIAKSELKRTNKRKTRIANNASKSKKQKGGIKKLKRVTKRKVANKKPPSAQRSTRKSRAKPYIERYKRGKN